MDVVAQLALLRKSESKFGEAGPYEGAFSPVKAEDLSDSLTWCNSESCFIDNTLT